MPPCDVACGIEVPTGRPSPTGWTAPPTWPKPATLPSRASPRRAGAAHRPAREVHARFPVGPLRHLQLSRLHHRPGRPTAEIENAIRNHLPSGRFPANGHPGQKRVTREHSCGSQKYGPSSKSRSSSSNTGASSVAPSALATERPRKLAPARPGILHLAPNYFRANPPLPAIFASFFSLPLSIAYTKRREAP